MMPACDHTGTPSIEFDGFRHFYFLDYFGVGLLDDEARARASVSPRQSASSLILASIKRPAAFG